MTPFAAVEAACAADPPRVVVVLGSGLGEVAASFHARATAGFADVPGLVPPTVAGHRGQVAVGEWAGVPAVVCFGRVHFYEGHPWSRVTRLITWCASVGVQTVILTNAAGGIRSTLNPGDLMAIAAHLPLLSPTDWRNPVPVTHPYSPELLSVTEEFGLSQGTYAAVTGPCYETPAEVRALHRLGADAVGMSTAREAEAAAANGLQVVAVSCITNKAAGLTSEVLQHAHVEATARTAVARLATVVSGLVQAAG